VSGRGPDLRSLDQPRGLGRAILCPMKRSEGKTDQNQAQQLEVAESAEGLRHSIAAHARQVGILVGVYVKNVLDDDVPGIAAELAYRFMFAAFPFAIFLVALSGFIASWLGVDDPSARIIGAIGADLPANLVGPVKDQLQAVLGQTQPTLLSFGALVTFYASAAGMSSLMKAMNRACGVRETRPFVLRLFLAGVLTVVAGVAIVVSFVAIVGGTLMTRQVVDRVGLNDVWPWLALLRWPMSMALLVAAVAALLRFSPAVRTPWRWAALSATAFAVVWLTATYIFGVYVARFATYDATYGALAGFVVLMFWFYLGAFVLVCAAELAAMPVRYRPGQPPPTTD
jgi:membrane protein